MGGGPEASLQLAVRGGYRLLGRVGAGGFGEVWKALDVLSGAPVALKLARDRLALGLLGREATLAALALSPRLPELVDVGWLRLDGELARAAEPDPDARPFLALRWVDGRPLSARRHGGPSSLVEALRVARDAAEALADLHAAGFAHGDVKPDNLLVAPDGGTHLLDLGLAGPIHATELQGATPRYLARGDADLGDARARDLIALGAVVAEVASDAVAAASDLIDAARRERLPREVADLCGALLAPAPGARPSASWVAESASASLRALRASDASDESGESGETATQRGERSVRLVRAAYLRIRKDDLDGGAAAEGTAPWLAEALARARRVRSLGDPMGLAVPERRAPGSAAVVSPLSPEQIARWLTLLAGSSATAWPLTALVAVTEAQLAEALTGLALRRSPHVWTFRDVELSLRGRARAVEWREPAAPPAGSMDAGEATRFALALARVPVDAEALERLERRAEAPPELLLAAADALRLRGELGRARSLVLRASVRETAGADAIAAEVLRRSGDLELAEQCARRAASDPSDDGVAGTGVLARICLDRGRVEEAAELSAEGRSTLLCEVAALAAVARGDPGSALAAVARGEALARTPEERARILAVRGFACHGSDPVRAHAAFTTAVDHAVRAGAVAEEASYRTGEAAAAVDLGELGSAIATSRRAALLWEHLGRPALAARALLAGAAAYASAGALHETRLAARETITRAREGGDRRAEAYAWWALADAEPAGDSDGRRAAEHARELLAGTGADDELRGAARLLRHHPGAFDPAALDELDRLAAPGAETSASARLDWWGVRAAGLGFRAEAPSPVAELALGALMALAEAPAAIGTRGPALAAGQELALRLGRGDAAQRLMATLGDAARELLRRAPPELLDAVKDLAWVKRAATAPESGIRPEQARDLERLVQSLSERERLGPLLARVVDALVLWTGVERGLLLLRAPFASGPPQAGAKPGGGPEVEGRLVVRAARNLARADLTGEQLALSQTLAMRALERREPVIAVDAVGELPSVHRSVHALRLRSVLALPLIARGEALGVVYLDDRVRRGAFGARELAWARTIASLAALAIADARDQVLLRRAVRKARRATADLADTLARREAALDHAERELAQTRSPRTARFKYEGIVGESEPIRAMLRLLDRVVLACVPVLIQGESGSGKELVARAIHAHGPRAEQRFVGENCGAIPEGLLESALFGHVRGAFTGADRPRAGLFDVADGGTLFLDEIGEMSLGMQAKLLRVLEDGIVKAVGSERERKVSVRILAATNRDLLAMVRAKAFREDLYYRLEVITLRVPALRERPEDVPLLVEHLLRKHGGGTKLRITAGAMERLVAFAWPGNVRQLENELRRAAVLSDGLIGKEHLSPEVARAMPVEPRDLGLNVRGRIDALETVLVREAMEKTKGNQTQAAKLLGLSRFGLQKMIKRLALG